MPSGMLNGRGCYDTMIKGEDESSLYLSIRHHNTSFLLEKRKALALEEQKNIKKSQKEIIDGEIKEWFSVGALPFARSCTKFLFLILVWPFYFTFYQMPQLALTKVIFPLVEKFKQIVEKIVRPIVNGFLRVYRPIAAFGQKIQDLYRSFIASLERPFLAFRAFVNKSKHQAHAFVISPPKKVLKKCRTKIVAGFQRCAYAYRAFTICCKLLVDYGLDQVRNLIKK
ncbi:MAG: hypothetical protein H0T62_07870 [Parachlamydiaceae bacterium]|nr:hypothetical protein [Parachlamydiaceae bacterium]